MLKTVELYDKKRMKELTNEQGYFGKELHEMTEEDMHFLNIKMHRAMLFLWQQENHVQITNLDTYRTLPDGTQELVYQIRTYDPDKEPEPVFNP